MTKTVKDYPNFWYIIDQLNFGSRLLPIKHNWLALFDISDKELADADNEEAAMLVGLSPEEARKAYPITCFLLDEYAGDGSMFDFTRFASTRK